jgi:type IV pilus assembly protein PilW
MLNTQHNKTGFSRDSGFTLIELMLAMVIGLIIMGGVMQMFITTRDTQRSSEDQMQLVSDARFIVETLSFDLRHAGIWGGTNETSLIRCGKDSSLACPGSDALPNASDDCSGGDWYMDLNRPLIAFNNTNPYVATCATQDYKLDTDVLGLHYADSIPIVTGTDPGELATGVVYVRSNVRAGQLFVGNTYPAETGLPRWKNQARTKNYALKSPFYYVSTYTNSLGDGVPSLHRVELTSGPLMEDKVLIPGVEDFQLEFGLDTMDSQITLPNNGRDFQVNTYVSADNVIDPVLGTNWQNGSVVAVKIWLLMRAQNADRDNIGGSQTFTMAGNPPVTYNDGVRRFLITHVVRLRNTFRRDLKKAGGP